MWLIKKSLKSLNKIKISRKMIDKKDFLNDDRHLEMQNITKGKKY